jgi:hypothetical protein
MNFRVRPSFFVPLLVFTVCIHPLWAQRAPNANAYYQQLRGLLPAGEVITIKDFVLKRDAATFTFRSGSVEFYGQVNGKVTGAIFRGEGHLHITPPTAEERHNLSIQTHNEQFDEDFDEVVLRFTDSTAGELRKASTGAGQPDNSFAKAAQELQSFLRHHAEGSVMGQGGTFYFSRLYGNLDLRLLEDVLSPAAGEYFFAAIHGSKSPHLYFIFDPHGVADVAPEEVALIRFDTINESETIPLAFHRAAEYAKGTPSGNEHNATYKILHQDLDVSIEKNGFLSSLATVNVRAEEDGVSVIPLDLYPSLPQAAHSTGCRKTRTWIQISASSSPLPSRKAKRPRSKLPMAAKMSSSTKAATTTTPWREKIGFPTPARDSVTTPPTTCSFMCPRASSSSPRAPWSARPTRANSPSQNGRLKRLCLSSASAWATLRPRKQPSALPSRGN